MLKAEIPAIVFHLELRAHDLMAYTHLCYLCGVGGYALGSTQEFSGLIGMSPQTFKKVKINLARPFPSIGKPLIVIEKCYSECGAHLQEAIHVVDIWKESENFIREGIQSLSRSKEIEI